MLDSGSMLSTYIHIVVKLHSPGTIQFHLFERLPDDIVRLSF